MKKLFTILILVVLCGCQTTESNWFPQEKDIFEYDVNTNFSYPVVIYKHGF